MELSSCKGKSPPSPSPQSSPSIQHLLVETGQGKERAGGGDDGRGHEIIGILSRRILCASSFNWLRDFSIPICTRLHTGKNVCIRAHILARVTCMCVCVCVCAREIFAERPTEWRPRRWIFSATEEMRSSFFLPSTFVDAATRVGFVFRGGATRRDNKLLADGLAVPAWTFLSSRTEIDDEIFRPYNNVYWLKK